MLAQHALVHARRFLGLSLLGEVVRVGDQTCRGPERGGRDAARGQQREDEKRAEDPGHAAAGGAFGSPIVKQLPRPGAEATLTVP